VTRAVGGKSGDLGGRIVRLRQALGLTQTELAARIGRSHASLGRIERGEVATPKPETLAALAKALGVDDLSESADSANRMSAWRRATARLTEDEQGQLLEFLAFLRWRSRAGRTRER